MPVSEIGVFPLQNENYVTLRDLKGSKLSGSIFNILFNLNKFMAFETRDPFLIRQVHVIHLLLCLMIPLVKLFQQSSGVQDFVLTFAC